MRIFARLISKSIFSPSYLFLRLFLSFSHIRLNSRTKPTSASNETTDNANHKRQPGERPLSSTEIIEIIAQLYREKVSHSICFLSFRSNRSPMSSSVHICLLVLSSPDLLLRSFHLCVSVQSATIPLHLRPGST
jgi:hypothetical protein